MDLRGIPAALHDIVHDQCGLVSSAQLTAAGMGHHVSFGRIRSGRWQQPHRGVYATFSGPLSRAATIWAALLRAGPGAVASHETAAELDGLSDCVDARVHVTVPADRRVRGKLDGVVIHYAHRLEQTRHPAKTPPRTRVEDTILDLIDVSFSGRTVEGWVTQGCQRRLTTPAHLAAALARRKKIKWRALAEGMLADVEQGAQSPLELRYLQAVERVHGLPTGQRQSRLAGGRTVWIDVHLELYRLAIELDGRIGHEGEGQFRDRHRDNRSTRLGLATLRYGYADVYATPCQVAAEIAEMLRERGWTGLPRPCSSDCPLNLP